MSKFLIGTIPVYGHVIPLIPIAQELMSRGHQICWYTGAGLQKTIEEKNIIFEPIKSWIDYSIEDNIPEAVKQARIALKGIEQLKFDLKNFFIKPTLGQIKDLQIILKKFNADAIITDSFFKGGSLLHELGGPVWADYSVTPFTFSSIDTAPFGLGLSPDNSKLGRLRNKTLTWISQKLVFQELLKEMNILRSELNLENTTKIFFDDISPFLYLAGTVPSFEYPRSDLPPQVHFVGAYVPKQSTVNSDPWQYKIEKKNIVVHISQGTIATDPSNLIVPALEGLIDEDISIIVTTGKIPSQDLLERFNRKNIQIETFIPYEELLPHVSIMITNGGYNGVQAALSYGIPLVVAGQSEDKREVNARVNWSGAGINLKTSQPSPGEIKKAFREIMSNNKYHNEAIRIRNKMRNFSQASESANLLERLIETKLPVYN